jgi:hypothetical protein
VRYLKGDYENMFKTDEFYIIVGKNSLIIKKKGDDSESIIDFQSFIPNTPFYYHLFDENKTYAKDIREVVKSLKIRKATILLPDDSIDLEVDKRILTEFFMRCGVRKVQCNFQCYLLNLENKKYISLSKTTRAIVIHYINDNKSISKKFYEKDFLDIEQILIDMRNLHIDCQYDSMPVYINNLNNDMEKFKGIGELISFHDIIANIMKV